MSSPFARVPSLTPEVRLRVDGERGWFLHTLEHGMRLSDGAAAVIGLIDGVRSVADIASALRRRGQRGVDTLEAEVLVLLRVLLGRGLVELCTPETIAVR